MIKTAIVILNWNGCNHLERFLPPLLMRTPADNCHIYVADNASTDGSIDLLQNSFPTVRIITFDRNYGFAGGYNKALRQIDAEYFVILNNDVEVGDNWLGYLLGYLDNNPEVAAVMPKIRSFHNKRYFEYAGAAGGFIDTLGFPFCRGRILNVVEEDTGQYNDDPLPVFWATGACLVVRSKIFFDAGMFDASFFAHMEEIDLCWRIQNLGYHLMVVPQSVVYHVGGGTLPNENPQKLYLNFRNNLFLLMKNLSWRDFYIIPLRMFFDGAAAMNYIFEGKISFAWAVVRAHVAFYARIPALLQQRKGKKRARLRNNPSVYQGSLVLGYYLRKVRLFSQLLSFPFVNNKAYREQL